MQVAPRVAGRTYGDAETQNPQTPRAALRAAQERPAGAGEANDVAVISFPQPGKKRKRVLRMGVFVLTPALLAPRLDRGGMSIAQRTPTPVAPGGPVLRRPAPALVH